MNVKEELYRSGATLTIRHVYGKRSGRVAVIDPYRRTRAAIVAMLFSGHGPRDIARRLDMPLSRVCALGIPALEARKVLTGAQSMLRL